MNYSSIPGSGALVGAYLLAGGASSRMGRDKALLLIDGSPLLVRLVNILATVSGNPQIIAPAGRYEQLGYRPIHDRRSGCGPLAGVETALLHSNFEWNLVLACDLPFVTKEWLGQMVATAIAAAPETWLVTTGENPLLAVWRKPALPAVQSALDAGQFRLRDLMKPLNAQNLIPPDPQILANWNRPDDMPDYTSEGKANLDC